MLTRLQVRGFKSLWDVDVRFGPFTCIAGPNAVGKSNLFDAIQLLSRLASENLLQAALSVRSEGSPSGNVFDLFHRHRDHTSARIFLAAEMIVPSEGVDDLGQRAKASITTLRYSLEIAFDQPEESEGLPGIRLLSENLLPIPKGDAGKYIQFPNHASKWRDQVVQGKGRRAPLLSPPSPRRKKKSSFNSIKKAVAAAQRNSPFHDCHARFSPELMPQKTPPHSSPSAKWSRGGSCSSNHRPCASLTMY